MRDNQVDIWIQPINRKETAPPETILNPSELKRYRRFTRYEKRAELLSSRLLLQKILFHYLPEQQKEIETIPDTMGRPFWYANDLPVPLYFSLSHTKDWVACAVASHREIGCDIEKIRPRSYLPELTRKVFTSAEQHYYDSLPDEKTALCFFYHAWTLKEALLKALGTGLRTPMTNFNIAHKVQEKPCCLSLSPQGGSWSFFTQSSPDGYTLAIASSHTESEVTFHFHK